MQQNVIDNYFVIRCKKRLTLHDYFWTFVNTPLPKLSDDCMYLIIEYAGFLCSTWILPQSTNMSTNIKITRDHLLELRWIFKELPIDLNIDYTSFWYNYKNWYSKLTRRHDAYHGVNIDDYNELDNISINMRRLMRIYPIARKYHLVQMMNFTRLDQISVLNDMERNGQHTHFDAKDLFEQQSDHFEYYDGIVDGDIRFIKSIKFILPCRCKSGHTCDVISIDNVIHGTDDGGDIWQWYNYITASVYDGFDNHKHEYAFVTRRDNTMNVMVSIRFIDDDVDLRLRSARGIPIDIKYMKYIRFLVIHHKNNPYPYTFNKRTQEYDSGLDLYCDKNYRNNYRLYDMLQNNQV